MHKLNLPSWLPYILPLALFMILPAAIKPIGLPYPEAYPISTLTVLFVELALWKAGFYPELKMPIKLLPVMIGLGIFLCALWFGIDKFTPHFAFLGSRESYNPFQEIKNQSSLWVFLAVRFAGLVVAAPIAEEMFYRAFLMRYLINPNDFKSVCVGKYELVSCVAAIVMMTLSHPEWLAAAGFSLAMNLLVYKTKSVGACVVAHGITNLALGLWVIYTHQWVYW